MADQSTERVVVTVDDQHRPTIQSVASALRAAGMKVTNVMPTGGIITGEVAHANVDALKKVSGVADVEPDQEMHAI